MASKKEEQISKEFFASKVANPRPELPALTGFELHLSRFKRHRGGMSFEDIAKVDGCKPKEVERSVKEIQSYRTFATYQNLETAQLDTSISSAEAEKKMLLEALVATTWAEDGKGKLTEVPDWEVRFQAEKALNEKFGILAKKNSDNGGFRQQIVVGVPGASKPAESQAAAVTSYEDVLRGVMAKRRAATTDDKLLTGEVISGG